jgi:peroxiredoxin
MRFGNVRLVLANAPTADGQASSIKSTLKRGLSGRAAFELALATFIIGFGIAQYLAYMLYHEQNRLILAEAVPLPRIEATIKASPPAPFHTTTPAGPTATPESSFSHGESRHPESRSYESKAPQDELAGAMALARLLPGSGRAAGELAPAFKLQNTYGEWVSLPSLRGKMVLLNFWATWCPACRKEMPSLESLYRKLHAEKGFVVLTVSVDQQGTAAVRPFLDRTGYDFPVLLDTDHVSSRYDVSGIPATFLIDGDGRIVWNVTGGLDWSDPEMLSAIEKLFPVS